MGGDGLDARIFATVETVRWHGGDQWWLHHAKCSACAQDWLIAQEERIYDEHFMRRLGPEEVQAIDAGQWPDDFMTYERVLGVGRANGPACRLLDPMASSLIWTVEDLLKARPNITHVEIAELLGISVAHVERLVRRSAR